MKIGKILLPLIIVVAITIFFSVFIVKEVNQAIVLQFGDPKKIIFFGSPNCKTIAWLTSLTINTEKYIVAAITIKSGINILPSFISLYLSLILVKVDMEQLQIPNFYL